MNHDSSDDDNQPVIPRVSLPRQRQDSTNRPAPRIPGQRQGGANQ